MKNIILLSLMIVIVFGCTGKESFAPDTTIPEKPILIPHLGDTGDSVYVNGELLNDTNNGLDTVPEGNWLRIQWQRIDDFGLDHMKIFRFGEYSELLLIDSLSVNQINQNSYLDRRWTGINPVGQKWSYYAEVYLRNGNYSVSDTVSYNLIEEPFLLSPDNYAQVPSDSLVFHWMKTEDAIHYRVLVFDAENEYIWHQDYYIIEDSDFTLKYTGPDLSLYGNRIIWRVDAFGDITDENGISISGAESNERIVIIID